MSGGLEVGSKAPDFTLLEAPGKTVTLSEELKKGAVVLVFYPADFSSVCAEELCTFRDALAEYNRLGVNVLAVSVDGIFSHRAFKKENGLQFPLLSDWEKEVIRDYNVVLEDLAGMSKVAKRAVFVIDKEGVVRYSWVSDDPGKLPPFAEVKEAVSKL